MPGESGGGIPPTDKSATVIHMHPPQAVREPAYPVHLAFVNTRRHKAAIWVRDRFGQIEDMMLGSDDKQFNGTVYYGKQATNPRNLQLEDTEINRVEFFEQTDTPSGSRRHRVAHWLERKMLDTWFEPPITKISKKGK